MSKRVMVAVDGRRRISLGTLARHDRYFAAIEEDGTVVLTPAIVVPITGGREEEGGDEHEH